MPFATEVSASAAKIVDCSRAVLFWAKAAVAAAKTVQPGWAATNPQKRARIMFAFKDLVEAHRAELAEHWPKVMRRVGGYNLDIFDNQSERPYTADGSVNCSSVNFE